MDSESSTLKKLNLKRQCVMHCSEFTRTRIQLQNLLEVDSDIEEDGEIKTVELGESLDKLRKVKDAALIAAEELIKVYTQEVNDQEVKKLSEKMKQIERD